MCRMQKKAARFADALLAGLVRAEYDRYDSMIWRIMRSVDHAVQE